MTVPELFFLALGLGLGAAAGSAVLILVRALRPSPGIRLTVTRNALPPREAAAPRLASAAPLRVIPVASGPQAPLRAETRSSRAPRAAGPLLGMPVLGGRDPLLEAVLGHRPASDRPPLSAAVALLEQASARPLGARNSARDGGRGAGSRGAGASRAEAAGAPPDLARLGDCAAERQLAEERCLVAVQARERAEVAAQELRDAQRRYDEAASHAEIAQRESDPRAVAELKEAARRAFRSATEQASQRRDLETAATTWLTEINRINRARRDAAERAASERQRADALLVEIEKLTVTADAARITAETATSACYEARQALATCEEAQLGVLAVDAVAVTEGGEPAGEGRAPSDDELLVGVRTAGRQPAIYRLLQGDRGTLTRIVGALAETPEERRRMQLLLSDLVDAIVAGAIEQAILDFPTDHPFWGDFTRLQCRDVAVALASLGYRFDGLGGFDGGRVPGTRDLSLAIGYAGLDPRRIRRWPNEAQAAELYREVAVAADEYLASAAADLSLGEMVALLGRRSEGLADLWNQWGRVRPLLLAATG